MLLPAVLLDTAMSAAAALARLARHGYWLDPQQPQARAWIDTTAQRLRLDFARAAQRLARDPAGAGAALRRQWLTQVLWYARSVDEVLERCAAAPADLPLLAVLGLHESDGQPPLALGADGRVLAEPGVVFAGADPLYVNLPAAAAPASVGAEAPGDRTDASSDLAAPVPPPPDELPAAAAQRSGSRPLAAGRETPALHAWPRLEAPAYVPARRPFVVTAGLAAAAQPGVGGGPLTLALPAGDAEITLDVELIADGLDARDGWSRRLRLRAEAPAAASVQFELVGRDPAGPEPFHLTTLELRYLRDGSVCGSATRPLVIGPHDAAAPPPTPPLGTPWSARPAAAAPLDLHADPQPPDLTIELAKADGNPASGRYVCRLFAPQPLADPGPFDVDLGDDARSFARAIVQQIRDYADDPLVENLLDALGQTVAERLPAPVHAALREAAARCAPRVPAVLLVSADPYVPWEIARLDPPLDPARPPFLGAQVALGRWLRDTGGGARPPAQPPAAIGVRHMAVMAGLYAAASGLRRLPQAEAEAQTLAQTYDAVALAATSADVKRLLDAQLTHRFQHIGGVEAVHFAGHGDVDPSQPDGAQLMLSEGRPLPSILFRSARYGGAQQPLLFLNACMIGAGGELLGDLGGFPGNCLKGGFGALLGALWEVDDTVAHQVALAFWQRALPTDGSAPQPVGELLRELRARYRPPGQPGQPPVATYLAYVYYGHPRLTLDRVS